MSTRAIITVQSADGKDVKRLYAHGDGYPSEVGAIVANFAKVAPSFETNAGGKSYKAAYGDWKSNNPAKREGRYHKFSSLGRAYSSMPNITVEPDKFVPALITYMTTKGYGGLYLTDRDPEKEAAAKGHGEKYGTDIEWHYVVTLGKDYGAKPKVETFESKAYGPQEVLYIDQRGKKVMYGSLQHFVSRGTNMDKVVEEEEDQSRKYREEQEKADKSVDDVVNAPAPKKRAVRRSTKTKQLRGHLTTLGGLR